MNIFHFNRYWQVALQIVSTNSHTHQRRSENTDFRISCQISFWQTISDNLIGGKCHLIVVFGYVLLIASEGNHHLLPSLAACISSLVTSLFLWRHQRSKVHSWLFTKSSALWLNLQGLCQSRGSFQMFAICPRGWEKPPCGRGSHSCLPTLTSLRTLQTCSKVVFLSLFVSWKLELGWPLAPLFQH